MKADVFIKYNNEKGVLEIGWEMGELTCDLQLIKYV